MPYALPRSGTGDESYRRGGFRQKVKGHDKRWRLEPAAIARSTVRTEIQSGTLSATSPTRCIARGSVSHARSRHWSTDIVGHEAIRPRPRKLRPSQIQGPSAKRRSPAGHNRRVSHRWVRLDGQRAPQWGTVCVPRLLTPGSNVLFLKKKMQAIKKILSYCRKRQPCQADLHDSGTYICKLKLRAFPHRS